MKLILLFISTLAFTYVNGHSLAKASALAQRQLPMLNFALDQIRQDTQLNEQQKKEQIYMVVFKMVVNVRSRLVDEEKQVFDDFMEKHMQLVTKQLAHELVHSENSSSQLIENAMNKLQETWENIDQVTTEVTNAVDEEGQEDEDVQSETSVNPDNDNFLSDLDEWNANLLNYRKRATGIIAQNVIGKAKDLGDKAKQNLKKFGKNFSQFLKQKFD